MSQNGLPSVPYGAVYFRKSNPPTEDWARDYATASEDGINIFRHWFLWSAIEVAPGAYDWADYDRQLDLAAEHGICTIRGDATSPDGPGKSTALAKQVGTVHNASVNQPWPQGLEAERPGPQRRDTHWAGLHNADAPAQRASP